MAAPEVWLDLHGVVDQLQPALRRTLVIQRHRIGRVVQHYAGDADAKMLVAGADGDHAAAVLCQPEPRRIRGQLGGGADRKSQQRNKPQANTPAHEIVFLLIKVTPSAVRRSRASSVVVRPDPAGSPMPRQASSTTKTS